MNRSAKFEWSLGVVGTLASLAASIFFAVGIDRLFRSDYHHAFGVILASLVFRLVVAWGVSTSLQGLRGEVADALSTHIWNLLRRPNQFGVSTLDQAATDAINGVGVRYLAASALTSMVGLFAVLYFGGWLSALIFLGLFALSVPFYIRAGRAAASSTEAVNERTELLAATQHRTLDAIVDMRSLGTVEYASQRVATASQAATHTIVEGIRVAMGSSLITEFIGGAAIGLVAMVVGFDLLHSQRSLEHALIALFLVVEINSRVRAWASAFHQREEGSQAYEILLPAEAVSPAAAKEGTLLEFASSSPDSTFPTLHLTVRAGNRVAIWGPSGSAKSTLLRTLAGLQSSGADELALTSGPIGWVQANSQLFAGTLRDNLCIKRPIESSDVISLLAELGLSGPRFADLDQVITTAAQFSDGERARLSLARALLANVVLLFVDDVAGLFDEETLGLVRAALDKRSDLAVIEAAHDRRIIETPTIKISLERL